MSHLCDHLSRLFEGEIAQTEINRFVNLVERQKPEFRIETLKALGLGLKQLRAGNPDSLNLFIEKVPKGLLNEGGTDYMSCFPVGSLLHKLVSLAKEACNHREDKLLSGCMKLHSYLVPPKRVPRKEADRIWLSINSMGPEIPTWLLDKFQELCSRFVKTLDLDNVERVYSTLLQVPYCKKGSYSLTLDRAVKKDDATLMNFREALRHEEIHRLYTLDPVEFGRCLISGSSGRVLWENIPEPVKRDRPKGHISFIPERGGKYRVVTVPATELQCLSYPLQRYLRKLAEHAPGQGVYGHDKCTLDLQGLIDGRRIFHSIDISSFTDRFPYALQRVLLSCLPHGKRDFDAAVMDCIASSSYRFQHRICRYLAGTPMGTNPSFALATICHSLLVHLCYEMATGKEQSFYGPLPFRVIGDDVVIYHDKATKIYKDLVAMLGMEVSAQKSMVSNKAIEMCSKWITPTGVHLQKKIKPISNENSWIENSRYYERPLDGYPSWSFLASLPYPYGLDAPDPDHILTRLGIASRFMREIDPPTPGEMDYFITMHRKDLLAVTVVPEPVDTPLSWTDNYLKSLIEDLRSIHRMFREEDVRSDHTLFGLVAEDLISKTEEIQSYQSLRGGIDSPERDMGPWVPSETSSSPSRSGGEDLIINGLISTTVLTQLSLLRSCHGTERSCDSRTTGLQYSGPDQRSAITGIRDEEQPRDVQRSVVPSRDGCRGLEM